MMNRIVAVKVCDGAKDATRATVGDRITSDDKLI
jgi:hypothetical protein